MLYIFKSENYKIPRLCNKKRLRHHLLKQLHTNEKVWCDVFIVKKNLSLSFYVSRKTSIRKLMREITTK